MQSVSISIYPASISTSQTDTTTKQTCLTPLHWRHVLGWGVVNGSLLWLHLVRRSSILFSYWTSMSDLFVVASYNFVAQWERLFFWCFCFSSFHYSFRLFKTELIFVSVQLLDVYHRTEWCTLPFSWDHVQVLPSSYIHIVGRAVKFVWLHHLHLHFLHLSPLLACNVLAK